MSAPISRRRALVLGGAGVVAVVAGTTGWIATADNGPGPTGTGSGTAETGAELGAPPLLDSSEGRLQIELVAAPGVRLAGRDTRALGFNGTSPGPTLRVRPGDELAIRLTNRLDQPTNLHTHGLRVSPQGNSDNPFLRVDPGTSFDYLIRVPTDHPPGTNWYHPHHHGTVADQVSGGLAGALIVDGGPALPVAADRVLLDQRHHPRHHRHPGPREPDGAHAGPRRCAGAGQRPTPARHPRRPPGDAAVADRQHLRGPGAVAPTGGTPARSDRPRRHIPARAGPPRSPRPAPRQPRGRARHPDRDRPVRPRHRPLRPRHHGRHEGRHEGRRHPRRRTHHRGHSGQQRRTRPHPGATGRPARRARTAPGHRRAHDHLPKSVRNGAVRTRRRPAAAPAVVAAPVPLQAAEETCPEDVRR